MFQLHEETPTHYIVKHPKGDVLKIAKSGLSKDMHAHIKKMAAGGVTSEPQKFDEGGEVQPEEAPQPIPQPQAAPQQAPVVVNVNSGGGDRAPAAQSSQAPQESPAAQAPAPQQAAPAPEQPPAAPQKMPMPNGSVGQLEQGLQQEAQVKAQLGQQQAGIDHEQVAQEAKLQALAQQRYKERHDLSEKTLRDYDNQHIDFNRVWNNASTPGKILSSIGIMFSSMGSGLTGQPNLALKVMNDAIDRDIKSQMAESDKKKTVFAMNRQMSSDDQEAIEKTRLGYQSLALAKSKEMLSKSMGPMAAAQMLQKSDLVQHMQKEQMELAAAHAKLEMQKRFINQNNNPSSLGPSTQPTTQPGGGMNNNAGYKSVSNTPEEAPQIDLGRMGKVDNSALNAYEMSDAIPKDAAKMARTEAQDYQESQQVKKLVLTDFNDMIDAVKQNRKKMTPIISADPLAIRQSQQLIGDLPFHIGEGVGKLEPMGGPISRQYATAKASALNKLNTLLTKRIGGEAMKNLELQVPDRADSDEEMIKKVERAMTMIDANTKTATLEGLGFLK